jgi:hypothetical protein
MYKKWVKNPVFRPKLHILLDDPHRNWHHSIENQILHLTQATRKLTQVMERIRTRKTRVWCQLHLRQYVYLLNEKDYQKKTIILYMNVCQNLI